MGLLGKSAGLFSLEDSDKFVGSYISINDAAEILEAKPCNLTKILHEDIELIDGVQYIDESNLRKKWNNGEISDAVPSKISNAQISLDEYIIVAIIRKNWGKQAEIEHQVKWGRKRIDLGVKIGKKYFFIEFLGPGHFTVQRSKLPENPINRKLMIEKEFNTNCILWPYWIQRCKKNIEVLIGSSNSGFGALWSTKVHFGDFIFKNSANIIQEITSPFNAAVQGFGYFYEEDNGKRVKPEHPIVSKIIKGRTKIEKILPNGYDKKQINFWLPKSLHK